VAQSKFVHTVAAGYVTARCFVLGISGVVFAQRTRRAVRDPLVRRGCGLASRLGLFVIVLGDESGYTASEVQRVKLAASKPNGKRRNRRRFTAFGIPMKLNNAPTTPSGSRGCSA